MAKHKVAMMEEVSLTGAASDFGKFCDEQWIGFEGETVLRRDSDIYITWQSLILKIGIKYLVIEGAALDHCDEVYKILLDNLLLQR